MKEVLREKLKRELASRGFNGGEAPNGTVFFSDEYFNEYSLAEMLELMVARREKLFRSVVAIGREAATESYNDAELVISAVKAVLHRLEKG